MAFMIPVVKNNWDIYKCNRSRRVCDCSNKGPNSFRCRKTSDDCDSNSDAVSLGEQQNSLTSSTERNASTISMSSRQYALDVNSICSISSNVSLQQRPVKSESSLMTNNNSSGNLKKKNGQATVNKETDERKRSC